MTQVVMRIQSGSQHSYTRGDHSRDLWLPNGLWLVMALGSTLALTKQYVMYLRAKSLILYMVNMHPYGGWRIGALISPTLPTFGGNPYAVVSMSGSCLHCETHPAHHSMSALSPGLLLHSMQYCTVSG